MSTGQGGLGNRFGGFSVRQILRNLDDAVIRSSSGYPEQFESQAELSMNQGSHTTWEVIEEYSFSSFSPQMAAERMLLFMDQTREAQRKGKSKATAKKKSRPMFYFDIEVEKLSLDQLLRDPTTWPRGTGIVTRGSSPGEAAQVLYRFQADSEGDKFVILEEVIS